MWIVLQELYFGSIINSELVLYGTNIDKKSELVGTRVCRSIGVGAL